MIPFSVERIHDTITVRASIAAKQEHWYLLRSDAHHDAVQARPNQERRHLDEAKTKGAGVLDFGDLFDAMQGRYDPRRGPDGLKDEYKRLDYFDTLVNDAIEFYASYAPNWVMFAAGNHERKALKHYGTDLTARLAEGLRFKHKSQCLAGGFSGWVRFLFNINKTQRDSCLLWYTHGAGGAAPVTRGVIKTNRRAVYLPDPDIIVSGHTHHSWCVPIARWRLSDSGKEYIDEQLHVQIPSYVDQNRWNEEKEHAPVPRHGAYWLRFWVHAHKLHYDVIRAH